MLEPETFGERIDGVVYTERLDVYAVIRDARGRFLVVDEGGASLPGGGLQLGEAADDALRRELLEGAAVEPTGWRYLDVARQLVIDDETGEAWEKVERFYAVAIDEEVGVGPRASWMELGEAVTALVEEAHRWAVETWGNANA